MEACSRPLLALVVVFGLCTSALAEMRTWTFKNGQTLEAEYVGDFFNKIKLQSADGQEFTIPMEEFDLSDADKEYLELEHPPVFKLEFRKSVQRKNYSMIRGLEDRPPDQLASFGAKVKQTSSGNYGYPLTVDFYALGDEIKGDRYILLDHATSSFVPSQAEKRTYEFYSKRIVRLTDQWNGSQYFSRRGEQYSGFLIVVRDKRGKVIAIDGSNDWAVEHFENLEKLKIGNYMNKECIRTYPSRPYNYIPQIRSGWL